MGITLHTDRGFSLPELMLTVAAAATIMGMALPVMTDVTQTVKLNQAVRLVERELQSARLKAVSTNSVLRVHLNCPAAGYVRTVELIGTPQSPAPEDGSANRCLSSAYPFPPADSDLATRPNFDGPVQLLPGESAVTSAEFEFHPDGTAYQVISNVAQTMSAPAAITVTRRGQSRTVTINGVGKVQLQ